MNRFLLSFSAAFMFLSLMLYYYARNVADVYFAGVLGGGAIALTAAALWLTEHRSNVSSKRDR